MGAQNSHVFGAEIFFYYPFIQHPSMMAALTRLESLAATRTLVIKLYHNCKSIIYIKGDIVIKFTPLGVFDFRQKYNMCVLMSAIQSTGFIK